MKTLPPLLILGLLALSARGTSAMSTDAFFTVALVCFGFTQIQLMVFAWSLLALKGQQPAFTKHAGRA